MESKAKIQVSIVTFNNSNTIENCLDSVFAAAAEAEIYVTICDNASSDNTVDLVRQKFPEVNIIESERNIGFGAGHNIVLRSCSHPLTLLLNPDAEIRKGMIERLVLALDEHPDVALAGPRVEYEEGWPQLSFGPFPDLQADFRQRRLTRNCQRRDLRTIEKLQRMLRSEFYPDWISGSCFVARTETLKRVGGFDERFFLYLEDVDLCRRLRALRMRVMVEPSAVCRHKEGASFNDKSAASAHFRRSRLIYENKHGSRFGFMIYKLLKARGIDLSYDFKLKWNPKELKREES